jgi:hypothetical protein
MANCLSYSNLIKCAKDTMVVKYIANMAAFNPPSKVNYDILTHNEICTINDITFSHVEFIHKDYNNIKYPWIDIQTFTINKSKTKKNIILLRIENKFASKDKKSTIIFSHGNSCDLSGMYSFLIDLSTYLKVDVVAYDYTGYGKSEGKPSEQELYDDVEVVMKFVISKFNLEPNQIVL